MVHQQFCQHGWKSQTVSLTSFWMGVLLFGLIAIFGAKHGHAQPQCEPPNMLIVLDNSNSMKRDNKLADANAAIRFVVSSYGKSVRFGLMTFCGPRWNRSIELKVPVGPTQSAQIATQLPQGTCFGTPMKKVMEEVRNYYRDKVLPADSVKGRSSFVLLVTDGKSTDGDPVLAVQALRALQSGGNVYDIKTYVVGFGSGVDKGDLTRMAQTGGTSTYYQANNQQGLQQAFTKIIQSATQEKCDGKDNDCDGQIDEDFAAKGTSCVGGAGCKGKGTWICRADGSGLICSAGGGGKPEVCNGLDDDCDGQIDETWPDKFKTCEAQGDCKNKGKWVCNQAGTGLECTGKVQMKSPEACDGDDNDCNGLIDDGLARPCETLCGKGFVRCENGQWSTCDAPTPSKEICDNIDNNCDGQIDEGADTSCQTGACRQGNCVKPCRSGECPGGFQCIKNYCIPPPCDPPCGDGLVCAQGTCQRPGCPTPCKDGEICRNNQCILGPCHNVTCPARQYCKEGKCTSVCEEGKCKATEMCVEGQCLPDPCSAVSCPPGGVCKAGICVEDLCASQQCTGASVCKRGKCVPSPCSEIKCPPGSFCIDDGQCWSKPQDNPVPGVEPPPGTGTNPDAGSTSGGTTSPDSSSPVRRRRGGCSCVGTNQEPSWPFPAGGFLVLLALWIGLSYRRR